MIKGVLKISCVAILVGVFGNFALAEDKTCCAVAGAGGFTLSEEDKAALQEETKEAQRKNESKESDKSDEEKQ